jgi:hypothetical protein
MSSTRSLSHRSDEQPTAGARRPAEPAASSYRGSATAAAAGPSTSRRSRGGRPRPRADRSCARRAPRDAAGVVRWTSLSGAPRQVTVIVKTDESPACTQAQTTERHQLEIAPRGPFRLDLTAWALRRRSHDAVDRWDSARYERVVSLGGGPVAMSVTQVAGPAAPRLSVLLAGRRIDQRAEALARETVKRLFGLSVDLSPFAAMGAPEPLARPNSPRAFPNPEDLASLQPDDLKRHGFSSIKGRTIIETAPGRRRRRSRPGGSPTARGWRGDRDTAGLRGGRPDRGALATYAGSSASTCCSTPCPALAVRSQGEAGRW